MKLFKKNTDFGNNSSESIHIKKIIYDPDPYFEQAGKYIIEHNKASIGVLQRVFNIGFNRAARIMDQLEEAGVVGEEYGTKPRDIMLSLPDFEYMYNNLLEFKFLKNSDESLQRIMPSTKDTSGTLHKVAIDNLGISIDYSNEFVEYEKISNCIVSNSNGDTAYNFVSFLIAHNPPSKLHLILVDMSFSNFSLFNNIENLLIPAITDPSNVSVMFNFLDAEMQSRIEKFLNVYARDIETYNERSADKSPKIIVVIDEVYNLNEIDNDLFTKLLQNSSRMGIYFVLFSKFALSCLNLGIKGNLLKAYTDDEFQGILKGDRFKTQEILDFDSMDGHTFEVFCADILRKNGYENVEVTKASGDQGIDLIAQKDGVKYGIQCKCYTSDIGNKAVQEAFAGKTFYNCHVAVVLTNRYFTPSARELAEKNGVILWDRRKLLMFIENIK